MKPGEDDEPIMWFHNILPRIKERYPDIPVYEVRFRNGSLPADGVSDRLHHRLSFILHHSVLTAAGEMPIGKS